MDLRSLFAATLAKHRAGRLAEAEAGYRRILSASPDHVDSLHLLGVVLTQSGRHREAAELIGRAIARAKAPAAEMHSNLGLAFRGLGQPTEAVLHFERAVTLKPGYAEAHANLGAVLLDEGRLADAERYCRQAITLKPDSSTAHFALGAVQHRREILAEAVASYREALRLRPAYPEAWCNLGAVLQEQGAFDQAESALAEALRLRPNYANAHYNLGSVLQEQGLTEKALASYRRAQSLQPDYPEAHWNEALLRLTRGEYLAGWAKYDWRWRRKDYPARKFEQPAWEGSDLSGQTILLHAEQGYGDTIQFIRYARLVKDRGASAVIVECQPALVRLLETAKGVDRVVPRSEGKFPSGFDCQAPMLSLPGLFRTTLDTIPAEIPYLAAMQDRTMFWRKRLSSLPGLRVGLVWRGNRLNTRDAIRSIPAKILAPLCANPGISWISLQIDARPDELDALSRHGEIVEFAADLTDWGETAALVSALDLVITVDTAVAHLAGALGKPVWILLAFVAHWCWLMERRDSPWYPSARLFRQSEHRAWSEVVSEVADELARL